MTTIYTSKKIRNFNEAVGPYLTKDEFVNYFKKGEALAKKELIKECEGKDAWRYDYDVTFEYGNADILVSLTPTSKVESPVDIAASVDFILRIKDFRKLIFPNGTNFDGSAEVIESDSFEVICNGRQVPNASNKIKFVVVFRNYGDGRTYGCTIRDKR